MTQFQIDVHTISRKKGSMHFLPTLKIEGTRSFKLQFRQNAHMTFFVANYGNFDIHLLDFPINRFFALTYDFKYQHLANRTTRTKKPKIASHYIVPFTTSPTKRRHKFNNLTIWYFSRQHFYHHSTKALNHI